MKYLNILFFLLMIPFIGVQYNDPDGLMWSLIYGVPTIWAALAGFRLDRVLSDRSFAILGVSVLFTLGLTVFYWPTTPGFWQKDVWWETETAREGMGMMIASVVQLVAAFTIWSARKKTVSSS
jgi:peptidoglycan/LPS O-acetylase OafA/YrhL